MDVTAIEPVQAHPPPLDGRRVLRQRWAELAYFHWRYPADEVRRLLPDGIAVDTFDGDAWVGLIPFVMRDVRVGPTPPVPYLGTFVEINVRTYVVDAHGRRAVWFWSLDVPRSVIVGVARTAFSLPYCWSPGASHTETEPGRHRYTMQRRWPSAPAGPARAEIDFTVGDEIAPDDVDDLSHFLSARWGLLTTRRDRVLRGSVSHPQWPLFEIGAASIDQTVIEAAGLSSPQGELHAMYSPGVDVEVGWLTRVRG